MFLVTRVNPKLDISNLLSCAGSGLSTSENKTKFVKKTMNENVILEPAVKVVIELLAYSDINLNKTYVDNKYGYDTKIPDFSDESFLFGMCVRSGKEKVTPFGKEPCNISHEEVRII